MAQNNIKEFTFPPFPRRTSPHLAKFEKSSFGSTYQDSNSNAKRPISTSSYSAVRMLKQQQDDSLTNKQQLSLLKQQIEMLEMETKQLREGYRNSKTSDLPSVEDVPLRDTFHLLKSKYQSLQKQHGKDRLDLQTRFDQLKREKLDVIEKGQLLQDKIKLLEDELQQVKSSRVNWRNISDTNYVRIKTEFDTLKAEHLAFERSFQVVASENTALKGDNMNLKQKINRLSNDFDSVSNEKLILQQKVKQLLNGKNEDEVNILSHGYQETIRDLKSQQNAVQRSYTDLETNYRSLQADYLTLENVLSKTKVDLETERNHVGEWSQKYRQSELEKDRLVHELEVVSKRVDEWQKDLLSRRAIMQEKLNKFKSYTGDETNMIPQELLDKFGDDPELSILALGIVKNVDKMKTLEVEIQGLSQAKIALEKTVNESSNENNHLKQVIASLKSTIETLEHELAGISENLSIMTASNETLKSLKINLEADLDKLKAEKAIWEQEHQEKKVLEKRLAEMEKAFVKMEEWKKVVGINEKISKQVFGLVRDLSSYSTLQNRQKDRAGIYDIAQDGQDDSLSLDVNSIDSSLDFALEGLLDEPEEFADY